MNSLFRRGFPWGAVCFGVVGITLTLGLWPFHAPLNEVAWLPDANGISFGSSGTVLSSGTFQSADPGGAAHSIEVWAQPHPWLKSGTLLSFYTLQNPSQLRVRDAFNDLSLQVGLSDTPNHRTAAKLVVHDVFRRARPLFITIASGSHGTALYLDGKLAARDPALLIPARSFTGRLVLGDSPRQPDSWWGQIRGLAMYGTELTAEETSRHYATWTARGRPEINADERNIALYLFEESGGAIVHNSAHNASHSHLAPAVDLYIPPRYEVVDKIFMEPFWQEFKMSRSYWSAALKNVVGFVPLGLCFSLYLTALRVKRAVFLTLAVGTSVSLAIELLQWFLPTRDSGMTDVFTNTLGTGCGLLLQPYANRLLAWRARRTL
ncbi:MAG TPA: VanZ family protein [Bryobacteraceae bacterium]|nr:VanZ family protein [Bryobacteraceae bacterium]